MAWPLVASLRAFVLIEGMNKHHRFTSVLASLWCGIVLLALAACSGVGQFTVTGKLRGLGITNVRVAYRNADGSITEKMVGVQDDEFRFNGEVAEATLLVVSDIQGMQLFRTVVNAGDEITVEGERARLNEVKIRGNETGEAWSQFISTNSALYAMPSHEKLDEAIEKFVKENPDNLLSTVLLLVDYSNESGKLEALLATINDKVKPASIMLDYNEMSTLLSTQSNEALKLMTFYGEQGSFVTFNPNAVGRSVLIFWDNATGSKRRAMMNQLEAIDLSQKNVMLADVYFETDTSGWRSSWRNDPVDAVHYWAPQGTMHAHLKALNIVSLPTVIVADSTGRQLYRGDNLMEGLKAASLQ